MRKYLRHKQLFLLVSLNQSKRYIPSETKISCWRGNIPKKKKNGVRPHQDSITQSEICYQPEKLFYILRVMQYVFCDLCFLSVKPNFQRNMLHKQDYLVKVMLVWHSLDVFWYKPFSLCFLYD